MSSAVGAIEDDEWGRGAVSVRCVLLRERGLCGVIVGVVDAEKMRIRVILVFVASHGLYFCHGVVDTIYVAVFTREEVACREFVYTDKLETAVAGWAQTLNPLSHKRVDGHPPRGVESFAKLLMVPSAVNSAAATGNMSDRRLERSVKSRI